MLRRVALQVPTTMLGDFPAGAKGGGYSDDAGDGDGAAADASTFGGYANADNTNPADEGADTPEPSYGDGDGDYPGGAPTTEGFAVPSVV